MTFKKFLLSLALGALAFSAVAAPQTPFYNDNHYQKGVDSDDVIQFKIQYSAKGGGYESDPIPAQGVNYRELYLAGMLSGTEYDIYVRDVTKNSIYQKCGGGRANGRYGPKKVVGYNNGNVFGCTIYW